ncbi:ORF889 [White spot syndrome virus]|uniref:ORF889 n=1 Tax=White spot syndrome virus TaxID=342409 RepID=A0A2D3I6F4_9VIRU|nr:ORF889 [White spot syndrome virus]
MGNFRNRNNNNQSCPFASIISNICLEMSYSFWWSLPFVQVTILERGYLLVMAGVCNKPPIGYSITIRLHVE